MRCNVSNNKWPTQANTRRAARDLAILVNLLVSLQGVMNMNKFELFLSNLPSIKIPYDATAPLLSGIATGLIVGAIIMFIYNLVN